MAEEESGGRVCFFYPRLSPVTVLAGPGAGPGFQREQEVEVLKPIVAIALRAAFVALPHIDENDAQAVLCYRSYFPAGPAAVY